jgi:hypothetical protein
VGNVETWRVVHPSIVMHSEFGGASSHAVVWLSGWSCTYQYVIGVTRIGGAPKLRTEFSVMDDTQFLSIDDCQHS